MTDWQRLEQVIKMAGLSTNAFALAIGLGRSETIYQIKRGQHGISKALAQRIVQKYPDINIAWLLTGEGEMTVVPQPVQTGTETRHRTIPYFDKDIFRIVAADRLPSEASDHIYIPGFEDCDFAAVVTGNDCGSEFPAASLVLVKQVAPADPVLSGRIYLVVTAEWVRMCSLHARPERPGELRLGAPSGSGEPFVTLDRECIRSLYLVAGVVLHKGF